MSLLADNPVLSSEEVSGRIVREGLEVPRTVTSLTMSINGYGTRWNRGYMQLPFETKNGLCFLHPTCLCGVETDTFYVAGPGDPVGERKSSYWCGVCDARAYFYTWPVDGKVSGWVRSSV